MYFVEFLEEVCWMMFYMFSKVVEYGGLDLFIFVDFLLSIKY